MPFHRYTRQRGALRSFTDESGIIAYRRNCYGLAREHLRFRVRISGSTRMNAAHFHLALNHFPIYGVFFGLAIVVAGRVFRSDTTQKVGLWILIAAAVFAIPVYVTGEPAEEIIEKLPGVSEAFIEHHEETAAFALAGTLALGLLGAVILFLTRGAKPITLAWWLAVVVLGAVTIGVLARTALLGGEIRHTEIR